MEYDGLIRKYLVDNPAVKNVSLKGAGPIETMNSHLCYPLGPKYSKYGVDGETGEVKGPFKGHMTKKILQSLASCRSMQKLTMDNMSFNNCHHLPNITSLIFPSLKYLTLIDTRYHRYDRLKLFVDDVDQWTCMEKIAIHDSCEPMLWKHVAKKLVQCGENVAIDLSNVWLVVTWRDFEDIIRHGCQMAIAGFLESCVWPFGLLDYGSATLRCKI